MTEEPRRSRDSESRVGGGADSTPCRQRPRYHRARRRAAAEAGRISASPRIQFASRGIRRRVPTICCEEIFMTLRNRTATRLVQMAALLGFACTIFTPPIDAKTLRWAGRGDMQTTDPHSQNENLTNNINAMVYEFLIVRDKKLGLKPALAESWTRVNPTTWRFKLRPGVKFHD